jgi:Ca2+-transporting ATPase
VGDIATLEPGEIIPCDGIFISGHNVKCDESGATGESDAINKVSFSEIIEASRHTDSGRAHKDCFIISGSKVLEGVGKYVIVAVGNKSFNGRIMMGELYANCQITTGAHFLVTCTALCGDTENTPLQVKLNNLAETIAKIGSAAGLFLFTALMIRFFISLGPVEPTRYVNMLYKQFARC